MDLDTRAGVASLSEVSIQTLLSANDVPFEVNSIDTVDTYWRRTMVLDFALSPSGHELAVSVASGFVFLLDSTTLEEREPALESGFRIAHRGEFGSSVATTGESKEGLAFVERDGHSVSLHTNDDFCDETSASPKELFDLDSLAADFNLREPTRALPAIVSLVGSPIV